MKFLISLSALLFLASFAFRGESAMPPVPAERLDDVAGLTELQIAERRQRVVRAQLELIELEQRQAGARLEDRQRLRRAADERRRELQDELSSGIDREQVAAVRSLSRNPVERAHQFRLRALALDDLTPAQTRQIEIALDRLAKLSSRATREGRVPPGADDPQAALRAFDGRFWGVLGFLLTERQMTTLKGSLPHRYQTQRNPQNGFHLPQLDVALAHRVRSTFLNLEAETAAIRTQAQRLEETIEATQSDGDRDPDRLRLLLDGVGTQIELLSLAEESMNDLLSHFSPEQRTAYDAVPPMRTLESQNEIAEALLREIPHLEARDRRDLQPQLEELQRRWRSIESEIERLAPAPIAPEERGAMEQLVRVRDLTAPGIALRKEVAHEIALRLSPDRLRQLLDPTQNDA